METTKPKKRTKKVDDSIKNFSFVEIEAIIIEIHAIEDMEDEDSDEIMYNSHLIMNLDDYSGTKKILVTPTEIFDSCPSCCTLQTILTVKNMFSCIHNTAYVYDSDHELIEEYDLDDLLKSYFENHMDNEMEEIENSPSQHRVLH
jgi:hypothetical protein